MKTIIKHLGWEEQMSTLFSKKHKHFGIPGICYLKLREDFEEGTHITIRFFKDHDSEKCEYLFQGWMTEKTYEELERIMNQLRIPTIIKEVKSHEEKHGYEMSPQGLFNSQ